MSACVCVYVCVPDRQLQLKPWSRVCVLCVCVFLCVCVYVCVCVHGHRGGARQIVCNPLLKNLARLIFVSLLINLPGFGLEHILKSERSIVAYIV